MRQDKGASAAPTGLSSTTAPLSVAALRASIPSAYLPALDERRSIARHLAFMLARAACRHSHTPLWKIVERARYRWTIAMLSGLIESIERGEQHEEQARWLADIDGGEVILRGIRAAAIATEARRAETGNTGSVHEGAGRSEAKVSPPTPTPPRTDEGDER